MRSWQPVEEGKTEERGEKKKSTEAKTEEERVFVDLLQPPIDKEGNRGEEKKIRGNLTHLLKKSPATITRNGGFSDHRKL